MYLCMMSKSTIYLFICIPLNKNRLLNTLTQALKSSGIDLSQANIAVQINLGKRAVKRMPGAASTICTTNKV